MQCVQIAFEPSLLRITADVGDSHPSSVQG